jgi:hypothetical protein
MTNEELEKTVLELKEKIDNILNTASEAEKKYNHDRDLEAFTERNGEALGKYSDKLKKLNGEDFDLMSSAFDEYNNDFSDVEESVYVAQLVSEIDNKISKLKEALQDDEIEIKSDEDTTEVKTDDETVETPAEEPKAEGSETETEEKEEKEEKDDDEILDEDEDEFVKDLEAEYDKYHK